MPCACSIVHYFVFVIFFALVFFFYSGVSWSFIFYKQLYLSLHSVGDNNMPNCPCISHFVLSFTKCDSSKHCLLVASVFPWHNTTNKTSKYGFSATTYQLKRVCIPPLNTSDYLLISDIEREPSSEGHYRINISFKYVIQFGNYDSNTKTFFTYIINFENGNLEVGVVHVSNSFFL